MTTYLDSLSEKFYDPMWHVKLLQDVLVEPNKTGEEEKWQQQV